MFYAVNEALSSFVWGPPMLAVFLAAGLFLSAKSGFFQLTGVRRWAGSTIIAAFKDKSVRKSSESGSISQLGALTSALAACLGTGNIIGVATAIAAGGPGCVFWMWLSAVLGMMTAFCENSLGTKYRVRSKRGDWLGGAMLYIERGLGMKGLARVFSFLLIGASLGMGNMTQANALASSLARFGAKPVATGAALALLTFFIISGGVKRICSFAQKLIPLLSGAYILAAFTVIFVNRSQIIPVLRLILKEAFTARSALGFGILKAARYGVARGVFSNEAGLGSSPIIHAASDNSDSAVQGFWGILEVFLDTVFMCTVTAFAILTSGAQTAGSSAMCAAAFSSVFGSAGEIFVCVCVCLFAFATLSAWSYYGKSGALYLFDDKGAGIYNIIYIAAAFIGCTVKLEAVWSLSDTFNGLMAVPNLFAVLLLSKEALEPLKKYQFRHLYAARTDCAEGSI